MSMNTHSKTNRGGSSILAVFFVSLFSVLAVSFAAVSNLNVQVSNNHKGVRIRAGLCPSLAGRF